MSKKKKKRLEEEVPEEDPGTYDVPKPPQKTSEELLSEKLLDIYNEAPPNTVWTLKQLMDATGATETEVCVTWHHMFSKKKVPLPQFVKP